MKGVSFLETNMTLVSQVMLSTLGADENPKNQNSSKGEMAEKDNLPFLIEHVDAKNTQQLGMSHHGSARHN